MATMDDAGWTTLGYATDTTDIIENTHRLRRSMHWNDDDYPERVFNVIERIMAESEPSVFDSVLEVSGLRHWLADNDPALFAELYGDSTNDGIEELTEHPDVGDVPELVRHARRIRSGLESDPEQAIGAAKELLETVMKTILEDADARDDIPALLKRVRAKLGIESGSDPQARMLKSLSQVVVGVAEIRNASGTGHGRVNSSEPDSSVARLAVDSAVTASRFLLDLNAIRARTT
jgi:hypothetical protein